MLGKGKLVTAKVCLCPWENINDSEAYLTKLCSGMGVLLNRLKNGVVSAQRYTLVAAAAAVE